MIASVRVIFRLPGCVKANVKMRESNSTFEKEFIYHHKSTQALHVSSEQKSREATGKSGRSAQSSLARSS